MDHKKKKKCKSQLFNNWKTEKSNSVRDTTVKIG